MYNKIKINNGANIAYATKNLHVHTFSWKTNLVFFYESVKPGTLKGLDGFYFLFQVVYLNWVQYEHAVSREVGAVSSECSLYPVSLETDTLAPPHDDRRYASVNLMLPYKRRLHEITKKKSHGEFQKRKTSVAVLWRKVKKNVIM